MKTRNTQISTHVNNQMSKHVQAMYIPYSIYSNLVYVEDLLYGIPR